MRTPLKTVMETLLTATVCLVLAALLWAAGLERTVLQPEGRQMLIRETGLAGKIQQQVLEEIPDKVADLVIPADGGLAGLLPDTWSEVLRGELRAISPPVVRAAEAAFDVPWIEGQLLLLGDDWAQVVRGSQEEPAGAIRLDERKGLFRYFLVRELTGLSPEILALLGITEDNPGWLVERLALVELLPDRVDGTVLWQELGGPAPLGETLQSWGRIRRNTWAGGALVLVLCAGLLWWLTGAAGTVRRLGVALILAGLAVLILGMPGFLWPDHRWLLDAGGVLARQTRFPGQMALGTGVLLWVGGFMGGRVGRRHETKQAKVVQK